MANNAAIRNRGEGSLMRRFWMVVLFGTAFGYFEAAVVVYLRAIFYPEGFDFPLAMFGTGDMWRRLLVVEVGREAASLVLISSAAWLFGRNVRRRFAMFMAVFAVWDITYYIWLKVVLGWPASILDWDILFLIPMVWASPVLAPVLVSCALLLFAVAVLRMEEMGVAIKVSRLSWVGFVLSGVVVVLSFCVGGLGINEQDYRNYFSWVLFGVGYAAGLVFFFKSVYFSVRGKMC